MAQKLILKFMDGQVKEATLARPFKPSENEINVILPEGRAMATFPISEICSILSLGTPCSIAPAQEEANFQEVETITGERYHVCILGKRNAHKGFYGIPVESDSPYKSIFFTIHGVKGHRKERPVGQILEESGLVPKSAIEGAIKDQQALRKRRVGEVLVEQHKLDRKTIEDTLQEAAIKGDGRQKCRVGDILVEAGLVSREQIEEALASQAEGKKKKTGTLLVERGYITEAQLLSALAIKFRMRFVDLANLTPSEAALKVLSPAVARQLQVFPIEARTGHLLVATSAPTDPTIEDSLGFRTNCHIELVVAPASQISSAINKFYGKTKDQVEDLISAMTDEVVIVEEEDLEETRLTETDSNVIRLVNNILIDAHKKRASDIHFEPEMGNQPLRVRYRVDGVCHIAHQIPATYKRAVVARIKILARLDIAEHRRPQSGKMFLRAENQNVEYRVEITPSSGGQEDAVLRILSTAKLMSLEEMGFLPQTLKEFKKIISKPYGIILCVGPTGSGKTTSLHSALKHVNTPDRKIWTAEDPVEITQQGLRQVQVLPKIGFTFQEALRSFLRADPDIIMIGEMRDTATAKIAIEASLTGHLVFSTLHTNSAPETVVRLIEMGMDPFNAADALLGVLAQRLARRLCEHCKEPYHPSHETYERLIHAYGPDWYHKHNLEPYSDRLTLMKKVGCERCGGSGYLGRIALHELLVGTENVKNAIRKNVLGDQLKTLAMQEGMRTLKMDGIRNVFQGLTDFNQVLKVCL